MSCSADCIQQTIPKQQILNFQFSKPIRLDLDFKKLVQIGQKFRRSQIRIYKLVVGSGEPDIKRFLDCSMFAYFEFLFFWRKSYK